MEAIRTNEKDCPRCGKRTVDAEVVMAERMPDRSGNRRHEPVGEVYYHKNGLHCAIPKVGGSYTIAPREGQRA